MLSRDGAVYTLPSQIGNNGDVLNVSGSTTSTNALCWSSISSDTFSDTGISNPVSGQVLIYNGNGWVNSNTCALTQLNFTNSGHGINIVCPNLTRDGDTYALPNWVGNTWDVLTVSSSDGGGNNTLSWSGSSAYARYLITHFTSNSLTLQAGYDGYVIDVQSTPSGVCYIHLPNLSSNTSFNVEIIGTINGSVAFYPYDPNDSGQMYILYNGGFCLKATV